MISRLRYKRASEPEEFAQIHRLNYRTFVQEIPQHPPNGEGLLIDRFHEENAYAICLDGEQLVGMVAVRARRPFSLDLKLADLDVYLPAGHRVCEARLLVIEHNYRNRAILPGLIRQVDLIRKNMGCTLAVISATTRQLKLYTHLGFVPFGPLVGTQEARFQPMYLTEQTFLTRIATTCRRAFAFDPNADALFWPSEDGDRR